MEKQAQDILKRISEAISKFDEKLPSLQKRMLEELSPLLKEVETSRGKILNNTKNLKLLMSIERTIEKAIINKDYQKSVNEFIRAFDSLSSLNIEYFKTMAPNVKPSESASIIVQFAKETTINDLIGAGLKESVIKPVREIIRQNIVSGGSYASFTEEVRRFIIGNENDPGKLIRYSGQMAKDAINQFNAQFHETIAIDLKFNWGRYVGSNIETTREFCLHLTKKEWIHRSELPEIIKGNIDGKKVKLSNSTGLPLGMIPGTTADNFKVRRGGYNCGHQFFWVADSAVPILLRNKFANAA